MTRGGWDQYLKLGGRAVGPESPCYVIAEIGGNFNGDLALALRSIDAAAAVGADAVKFQTFRAEDFIADRNLMYSYLRADGTTVTESQYEMFKAMEFPHAWHLPVKQHAERKGLQFLSSAADTQAVDLLVSLGVPAIKIASEDLINIPVVERAAASGLPALISSGMATAEEISHALDIFASHGNMAVALLHCTSRYPTPADACNLRRMVALRERFGMVTGFSDHTLGGIAAVMAVALGAAVIEKHFTLDRSLPGPDHAMSMDPVAFRQFVDDIRAAEASRGGGGLDYHPSEEFARVEYRRSIVAARRLVTGTVIAAEMLAYRRPGHGLRPYEADQVLGRLLRRDLDENECIAPEDLE